MHVSLKTFAEAKAAGVSKMTGFRVDPGLIKFEPGFNLREEGPELDAHIERLYQAMKAGAFIPPIDVSVVNGEIIARDGHCRTRAALRLKDEVPEITLECRQLRGNEVDAVLHMLGTGSGGKPLSPLEQGKGFIRLARMGLKACEIAVKLGITRQTVENNIRLAEAPVEVHQMIVAGEVAASTALTAVKAGADGVQALKEAVQESRQSEKPKKVTPKALAAKVKPEPKTAPLIPDYEAEIEELSQKIRDMKDAIRDHLEDFEHMEGHEGWRDSCDRLRSFIGEEWL